jgi:hypothetical protein
MGKEKLVSWHVSREEILTEVADRVLRPQPSRALAPNHFPNLCNL